MFQKPKTSLDRISTYLHGATFFYSAGGVIILLTLIFLVWPTVSGIITKTMAQDSLQKQIIEMEDKQESMKTEYNTLKTKVDSTQSEVVDAINKEVLPPKELKTELVRFFERKIHELDISGRDFLLTESISFGDIAYDTEKGFGYVTVKIPLKGSMENFYRFMSMIENSGVQIAVDTIQEDSPAYRAGLRNGDIVKSFTDPNFGDGQKVSVIFPWVLDNHLRSLKAGDQPIILSVLQYNELKGMWEKSDLEYTVEEEEQDPGATFALADSYMRLMNLSKISAKVTSGDDITGEGSQVDFEVEIKAYFKPNEIPEQ